MVATDRGQALVAVGREALRVLVAQPVRPVRVDLWGQQAPPKLAVTERVLRLHVTL